MAVLGRPVLYAHEIYRINAAENVKAAWKSRQASANWVTWARENPEAAELLTEVERMMDGG